jgi:hypothetical protein
MNDELDKANDRIYEEKARRCGQVQQQIDETAECLEDKRTRTFGRN